MSDHKRNTDNMVKFNRGKNEIKSKAVDDAIKRLIKNRQPINFNSVISEAGVSKGYLYNNSDHRRRIEDLRQQQTSRVNPKQIRNEKSDASKDVIITSLKKRIKEQEDRLIQLENENRKLRGKIYDLDSKDLPFS